jgi:hypothetical protein
MGKYFARTRDGIVVQVHAVNIETGMSQVTPVYKTDRVWVDSARLSTTKDPHAWSGRQVFGWLLILGIWAYTCWNFGFEMAEHGIEPWRAGLIAASLYGTWTGLSLRAAGLIHQ